MDERVRRTKEIVLSEIDGINQKGSLNETMLCNLDKLVDIYKDIETIEAMDDYGDDGYSERRYYDGGSSYGLSRGYSRGGDMIDHLRKAMDMARTETERDNIRRMIDQMSR